TAGRKRPQGVSSSRPQVSNASGRYLTVPPLSRFSGQSLTVNPAPRQSLRPPPQPLPAPAGTPTLAAEASARSSPSPRAQSAPSPGEAARGSVPARQLPPGHNGEAASSLRRP